MQKSRLPQFASRSRAASGHHCHHRDRAVQVGGFGRASSTALLVLVPLTLEMQLRAPGGSLKSPVLSLKCLMRAPQKASMFDSVIKSIQIRFVYEKCDTWSVLSPRDDNPCAAGTSGEDP